MAGKNSGYYDPNIDYSLAIKNAQTSGKSQEYISQLQQERQNKIDAQYGGTDPYKGSSNIMGGYTKPSSSGTSGGGSVSGHTGVSGTGGTYDPVSGGVTDYYQAAINAAQAGDWESVTKYLAAREQKTQATGQNYGLTSSEIYNQLWNQYGMQFEIPEFQFPEAPSYTPMYDALMNSQLQEILNSSFQDWAQGSDYQYLYDKYAGNGQKAMQDVLGQLAARTGGYASSYATAAAGQSYNDYMATLEDAARAMYQDQLNQQMQNLGLLTEAENNNYTQYLNALNQWNTDRSQAYNQYLNNLNWQYQLNRDQIEDQRYNSETAYGKEQDAWEREQYENEAALDRAILAAQYGDYSGLKALGINPNMAMLTASGSSSGGSKSGSSGKRTSSSGGSYNNGGLTTDQVAQMQRYFGTTADGMWGSNSKKAAGGLTAQEAWDVYQQENADLIPTNRYAESWVEIPGHGRFSWQEVLDYVEQGKIKETIDRKDGTVTYSWVG